LTAAYISDYIKCFRVVHFTPEDKLLTNLLVSEFLTTSTKLLNLGSYLKCGHHTHASTSRSVTHRGPYKTAGGKS